MTPSALATSDNHGGRAHGDERRRAPSSADAARLLPTSHLRAPADLGGTFMRTSSTGRGASRAGHVRWPWKRSAMAANDVPSRHNGSLNSQTSPTHPTDQAQPHGTLKPRRPELTQQRSTTTWLKMMLRRAQGWLKANESWWKRKRRSRRSFGWRETGQRPSDGDGDAAAHRRL